MKDKTMAYGIYFGLGFLAIAIFITIVLPVIRDVINDADDTRPTIPTSYNIQQPYEQPYSRLKVSEAA